MTGDNDRVQADPDLLAELQAGRPALPEMYELTPPVCAKVGDTVEVRATLTNTSDIDWLFDVEYSFTTRDGDTAAGRGPLDLLAPGDSIDLHSAVMNPDDYDDPPRCMIAIYDSVDLAYNPALEAKRP